MAVERKNPGLNTTPELLDRWVECSTAEGLRACPLFARLFFGELEQRVPSVHAALRFMTLPKSNDVWAFHDTRDAPLGVLIDVDLEYIVVWSAGLKSHGEHGDWGEGVDVQVERAIRHALEILRSSDS